MSSKLLSKYKSLPLEVRASFWFLVSAFFQRGISVITTPLFTRLMSTEEYGEFSVFYSWYGIVVVIVTLNLFFGVSVRGLVKYEDDKNVFMSSMQGLALTLTLCWLVIYLCFSTLFNNMLLLTTEQVLCMFIIIVGNSAYGFWAAEKRVDFHYRALITLSVLTAVATPMLQLALMLVVEDTCMARIYGMTVVYALCYIPLFVIQMRRGKVYFSVKYWTYALRFNIPLIPHYLSQTVLNSADRLMINSMVGPSEAGIYSLAYSIAQIMVIFNSSLMQTIEPWLYKKIKSKEIEDISKVAYPAFLLIAIANLALIAFAPEVVALFAPSEYYDAIWIIPPVAMGVFFQFAYTFFAVFEFYYEKTHYVTLATLAGAALNIALNYVFIGLYGYFSAGYTTLVCYAVYAVCHYLFMNTLVKKHHPGKRPYDSKVLLAITAGLLLGGFSLLLLYSLPVARYAAITILLAAMVLKRKALVEAASRILTIRKSNDGDKAK